MSKILHGIAVAAVLSLAAGAAQASSCGGDGPPCINPNPPPSAGPTKPAAVVTYGSVSSKSRDEGAQPTQYVPIADGVHKTGTGQDYVVGAASVSAPTALSVPVSNAVAGTASAHSTLAPVASVTAQAEAIAGTGGGLGQIGLIYMVSIHALDTDAANALAARLGTSGAIATASGNVLLGSTGQAYSTARITTGDGIFNYSYDFADDLYGLPAYNPTLLKRTSFDCDSSGFFLSGGTSGCGANTFSLAVNFVRASVYDGGSNLDFIGNISLLAGVNATGFNGLYGQSHAFVDPTVTLAADLNSRLYRLTVGNGEVGNGASAGVSATPEPSAWALMLMGFGLAGAGLRRRRAARDLHAC